jgi:cyclic dehypoxanthinyl futalosine synthase
MSVAERTPVAEILEKATSGERITDEDAIELLRSRDLVAVGRAANEIRNRLHDPERVTFIIDRNLNYTNVCVTDCDFCAFYRRPGDQREGYLLPKPVIFKKIEETLALGGTGLLMQGGHHPDLGVDYYEDLFSSIKARYQIHLHALSPSEIIHAARRSKLTVPETLARMRDAGLDSIPGGGAEILVDRVREIIAPKKAKTKEWLGVMREAHRLGISTTATSRRSRSGSSTSGGFANCRTRPAAFVRSSRGRSRTTGTGSSPSCPSRRGRPRSTTSSRRPSRGSTSTTCRTSARRG